MKARPSVGLVWLGVLVAVAATARLGMWQLDRAAQKTALVQGYAERVNLPALAAGDLARDTVALAPQLHRRIGLAGRWLAAQTVFLDNRMRGDGQAGFVVVTPLLIGPGDAVLVQRGWTARDPADRTRTPAVTTPEGEVRIEARIATWPSARLALGAQEPEQGPIRQNLDPAQFTREAQVALRPLSLLQLGGTESGDALQRDWPAPPQDVWKHHGYAVQWFAISALIAGLAVWHLWIKPRRGQRH